MSESPGNEMYVESLRARPVDVQDWMPFPGAFAEKTVEFL
jgi:hypothetical protein